MISCPYCWAISTSQCMHDYHCMLCSWGIIWRENKRNNHPRYFWCRKAISGWGLWPGSPWTYESCWLFDTYQEAPCGTRISGHTLIWNWQGCGSGLWIINHQMNMACCPPLGLMTCFWALFCCGAWHQCPPWWHLFLLAIWFHAFA